MYSFDTQPSLIINIDGDNDLPHQKARKYLSERSSSCVSVDKDTDSKVFRYTIHPDLITQGFRLSHIQAKLEGMGVRFSR